MRKTPAAGPPPAAPSKKRPRTDDAPAWGTISAELLRHVFGFLSHAAELVHVAEVCKAWHSTSKDASLWQKIDLSDKMFKNKLTDPGLLSIITRSAGGLKLHDAHMVSFTLGIKPVLGSLANLTTLSLKNLSISYDGIIAILKVCSNLRELELNQSNVTDAALKVIAESPSAKTLTRLNLRASTLITDEGTELVLRACRSLTSLDLSWCTEITLKTVELIVTNVPGVRHLNLRWCRKVPWSAMLLLPQLRGLTSLNISHIGRGIPRLAEIDVRPAREYLQALARLQNLEKLEIAGLPFANQPETVSFLVPAMPRLREFTYKPESHKQATTTIQQQSEAAQKDLEGEDEETREVMQHIA